MKKRIVALTLIFAIMVSCSLGTYQTVSADTTSWEEKVAGAVSSTIPLGYVAYLAFSMLGLGVAMTDYDSVAEAGQAMWDEFETWYYDSYIPTVEAYKDNKEQAQIALANWLAQAVVGLYVKAGIVWEALTAFADYVKATLNGDISTDVESDNANVKYSHGGVVIKKDCSLEIDSSFLTSYSHIHSYQGPSTLRITNVEKDSPIYMRILYEKLCKDGIFYGRVLSYMFYSRKDFSFDVSLPGSDSFVAISGNNYKKGYGSLFGCSYHYNYEVDNYGNATVVAPYNFVCALDSSVYYDYTGYSITSSIVESIVNDVFIDDIDDSVTDIPIDNVDDAVDATLSNTWVIDDSISIPDTLANADAISIADADSKALTKDKLKEIEKTLDDVATRDITLSEALERVDALPVSSSNIPVTDTPANSDLSLLGLEKVFPFCIPFDIYKLYSVLSAKPVAPKFTWKFKVLKKTYKLDIDLSDWNEIAELLRLMEFLAFCLYLAYVTREKMVKA